MPQPTSKPPRKFGAISTRTDWVFLRKFEIFVFAFMFLAVPFFALKVVSISSATLSIKNTTVGLVRELETWRAKAKNNHLQITIQSQTGADGKPFSYSVIGNGQTLQEVLLPSGVAMIGSVTFKPDGEPKAASLFIIYKGARSSHVEVDSHGLISAP
jgi:hypothetical protein